MTTISTAAEQLAGAFAPLPALLAAHARDRPDAVALADEGGTLTYAALDRLTARVAAALQRDGVVPGQAVAIVAVPSIVYAALFMGTVRAGCAAAPLSPSATPAAIATMIADCGAPIVMLDAVNAAALADQPIAARRIVIGTDLDTWLGHADAVPLPVTIDPGDAFNIIYSSGTTGRPKGIVQSHAMRWQHLSRNSAAGFDTAVTMIATPLYSNTTLVSFLPTLAWGGTAVLMAKFDAAAYLALAERHRATHTMLVPVQYQRLMAHPRFDDHDLSHFRFKTATSAPFSAALKADVLARWPGILVEYYGMTEGGASCALNCTAHPDKLHTVGQPMPGHEICLIDDDGREVAAGATGEVVGRSPAMMTGYHGRAEATRDAEWFDADGRRFIRHGDVARFDEDGFLILMDRKKDLVISGGFNIYPSDLEAVLADHPDVADCTVIGMPSPEWGETPVGIYVARPGAAADAEAIRQWANARLGRTQRLSALHRVDELPRSAIGKVLKRTLRDTLLGGGGMTSLRAIIDSLARDDDGWHATIPAGWQQGRTAYGGVSTALALHVAMGSQRALPPLRSAQVAFVGPLSGAVTIRTELLRRGRNAAFVQADVVGDAGLGLRATFVFMAPIKSKLAFSEGRAPAFSPPGPDTRTFFGLSAVPFTQNFELLDQRDGLAPAEWLRWVRLRERDGLDPMVELAAIADCLPPAAVKLLGGPAPLSSMTWLLNLLHPPVTRDGWFLLHARADHAAEGNSSQQMRIWNADGTPIAEHLQSVAIFA